MISELAFSFLVKISSKRFAFIFLHIYFSNKVLFMFMFFALTFKYDA